jgi:hypothetical protein
MKRALLLPIKTIALIKLVLLLVVFLLLTMAEKLGKTPSAEMVFLPVF